MIGTSPASNTRRALRISAGMTLAEVAAQVGVATTTVFGWDRYGVTPRRLQHRQAYQSLLVAWAGTLTAELARVSA